MTLDPINNIFDLQSLANEIIGDVWLTIALVLIFTFILTIKFRMPFDLVQFMGVLILFALGEMTGIATPYILGVLYVGWLFYYNISRAID